MQDILTYIIVFSAAGYIAWQVIKQFLSGSENSRDDALCDSCPGCAHTLKNLKEKRGKRRKRSFIDKLQ